uniref:Receptor ligand binding region domain-containing protein n=1 Tax=Timema cristinae TaxID=61476 RepID=A0A7R9CSY5_TIMCR|nr:unnamed protein product [Timema cristinae]
MIREGYFCSGCMMEQRDVTKESALQTAQCSSSSHVPVLRNSCDSWRTNTTTRALWSLELTTISTLFVTSIPRLCSTAEDGEIEVRISVERAMMNCYLHLLLVSLLTSTSCGASKRMYLNYTGDIMVGALFPIHRKGSNGTECGRIQPLEAMIFTLNQINNDPKILPGIKLGMLAFDSCDSQSYGLEQSLNFVKGKIYQRQFINSFFDCHPGKLSPTQSLPSSIPIQVNYHQHNPCPAQSPSSTGRAKLFKHACTTGCIGVRRMALLTSTSWSTAAEHILIISFFAHFNEFHEHEFQCNDGSTPKFRGGGFDQVVSVIGAQSSSVTIQVATMLRLFRVPLVSYMATSTSLSNKERFPYFFRTVPSDINQAHAMLEILRYYKMDDNITFWRCSVVVVFAEKITMFNLLDSARRTGYESRFVWIGSDAWVTSGHREPRGSQHSPDDEHLEESVLEGALAIQPLVQKLIGFDEYFKSLTLDHEKDNPWFREYWREYFKCGRKQRGKEVLGHASKSANEESEDYCMTSNKNLSHGGYKQQRYLHFVRDAVYSVAHALHDLQVYLCGAGKPGVCDSMKHIDGETLHGYLHNVSFNVAYCFLEYRARETDACTGYLQVLGVALRTGMPPLDYFRYK